MSKDLRNPFPGMNPWLVLHWHSVHASFITYARDHVAAQLPEGLAALTEERVAIENLEDEAPRFIGPDVAIKEAWESPSYASAGNGAVALAEPVIAILEDPVETSMHIVDSSGALITAVELLSPTNKRDPKGREDYLRKQRTYQKVA